MNRFLPLFAFLLFPLLSARQTPPHNAPARPGGKDYALFFAVEKYDNNSAWKNLPGLIDECEAIKKELIERYGFSTESQVVRNPSRSDIAAELARWRSRDYGPDDQLLVFFSGHGQFLDDLQEGFFIPSDGKPGAGEVSERKWYSLLQLPRHVTTIKCNHILLAIDACYSGTIDSRVALKNETEEWAEPASNADALFNQYVHDLLAHKSRILMTSGGKNRTKHPSDFVRWFREALATLGGPDHIVRPSDIEERWPTTPSGRPLSGTFEGHEPGGNFLFVYQPKITPPSPELSAKQPDYDDDGTPDATDKCPYEPGPAATKGCPDTDGDGVADKFDRCKTEQGPAYNDGCPVLTNTPAPVKTPATVDDPLANSMVYLEGGEYTMGSSDGESDEKPPHKVEVSSFLMSKYEVTIGQYLAFCAATDSHWPVWLEKGSDYNIETGKNDYYKKVGMSRTNTTLPVTGVSWNDAVAYCAWLKEKTGRNYRLPTEAEWEYAARGGMKSKGYTYSGSNDPKEVGWYNSNSNSQVHAVGSLKENEAGLYDMSGNVWEWCADWYDASYYKNSPRKDPQGPNTGSSRVCRGGSWYFSYSFCRSAIRFSIYPTSRINDFGFRVAQDK